MINLNLNYDYPIDEAFNKFSKIVALSIIFAIPIVTLLIYRTLLMSYVYVFDGAIKNV